MYLTKLRKSGRPACVFRHQARRLFVCRAPFAVRPRQRGNLRQSMDKVFIGIAAPVAGRGRNARTRALDLKKI
jgi:hypothetical protein